MANQIVTQNGQKMIQSGNQYTNPAYASPSLLSSVGLTPQNVNQIAANNPSSPYSNSNINTPLAKAIGIDTLTTPQPNLTIPTPATPSNPTNLLLSNNAGLVNSTYGLTTDSNGNLVVSQPTGENTLRGLTKDRISALIGLNNQRPSAESIYNNSPEKAQFDQASQDVNRYASQINTIVAKSQADQLSLVGQGRGIPEAIIGGQQAQIAREAAIQALPLQALLANAQGNKELAQQSLDTMFKLRMEDAQNAFDFKTKLIDTFYNAADKEEQRQFDAIKEKDQRNFELFKTGYANVQNMISDAIKNNDAKTASALAGLTPPDATSPTFTKDVATFNSQIAQIMSTAKPDALKQLQIAKAQKELALLGEPTATEKAKLEAAKSSKIAANQVLQDKIDLVDYAKSNPGLSDRVGTNAIARNVTGQLGVAGLSTAAGAAAGTLVAPVIGTVIGGAIGLTAGLIAGSPSDITGTGQQFAGAVHKLASKEFLQALIDAKSQGATFGALTDREGDALRASATAINDWEIKDSKGLGTGYWNIDEASMLRELDNIKTLAQRAIMNAGGTLVSPDEQSALDTVFSQNNALVAPQNYYSK